MALGSESDRPDSQLQTAVAPGQPNGDSAASQAELAAVLERIDALTGSDDAAAAALAKAAAEQFPAEPLVGVRLADLAMRAGDADAAVRGAVEAATAAPDNAAVVARSAAILTGLGRAGEAFAQLSKVVAGDVLLDEFVATATALRGSEIGPKEALRLRDGITALMDRSTGGSDARQWTIANLAAEVADRIGYNEAAVWLRVRGHIDVVDEAGIAGWAFDVSRPDRRCELEVVSNDGKVIAQGRADQPRRDLAQAGFSDGAHGFRIAIPHNTTTVFASAVVRDSLTRAPIGTYTLPRFMGGVDHSTLTLTSTHVTGWCIDRLRNKLRPKLVGLSGEREFPIGTASLYRRDLVKAGLGDGFNGFEFPVRVLRGAATFSVVEVRTGTVVLPDVQFNTTLA